MPALLSNALLRRASRRRHRRLHRRRDESLEQLPQRRSSEARARSAATLPAKDVDRVRANTAMSEPDLSAWPTKAAAAAPLHCSVRVLELRIQVGEIEVRPRRQAKLGSRRELVCNPDDISRLQPPAFEMPADERESVAGANARPDQQRMPAMAPPALPALAAWLATTSAAPQRSEPAQTLWIPINEAAQITGLSKIFLRRACEAKTITAVRDGRQWKIQRAALARASFNGSTAVHKS